MTSLVNKSIQFLDEISILLCGLGGSLCQRVPALCADTHTDVNGLPVDLIDECKCTQSVFYALT